MKQSSGPRGLARKEGRCSKKKCPIPDNHQGILLGTMARNHRHGNPFPKPKRTWKHPLLFDKRVYNPFPKEKRSSQMLIPQKKAFHRVRLRYPPGGQHFHQVQIQVHQVYSRNHQVVIYRGKKTRKTFQSNALCTSINTGWSHAGLSPLKDALF